MSAGQGDALDRHLDAAAALIGLPVAPEHRPGVLAFLGLAATMATVLDSAAMPAATAPLAPVLHLPEAPPRDGRP